ncbi:hypothetical protein EES37_29980 [Streptomyces sp. ADI91-18]|nr:hypothetical protein EES37_29980 [Streptomyces sp. ADI91-18]
MTHRVRQPLDEQYARTLSRSEAVGGGGERLAAAVGGDCSLPGELHEHLRRRHHGRTAREGEVALTTAQRPHRQMQRDQRRRTCRVHRQRRPLQAQGVRDAARHDAGRVAGAEVAVEALAAVLQQRHVVLAVGSHEHAGTAAASAGRVQARTFERFPGEFQDDSLLWVHRQGLTRRDAEEPRVELPRVVEEAALTDVGAPRRVRIRVVQARHVPPPVDGQVRNGVAAGFEQLPELVGCSDVTGEAAGHADDGDRLVLARRRRTARGVRLGVGAFRIVLAQ